MSNFEIQQGDALTVLKTMPSDSVHCVVTSPPYYNLRDYGAEGQLGLESRPDCLGWATGELCGECYICHMVAVFSEVKRVLRRDGVCWLNIGDLYAQDSKWGGRSSNKNYTSAAGGYSRQKRTSGIPDKNLMMIPARLALALQAAGWYVRSEIIWHKLAAMPESVEDRPTRAHEQVYLLTKSPTYFYDSFAVREPARNWGTRDRANGKYQGRNATGLPPHKGLGNGNNAETGRNMRSVLTFGSAPFAESHFATFPPALPATCIKAGTSERGCCPACGKCWNRITETDYEV